MKHIMLVHDIIPHLFPEYLNNGRKEKYYALARQAVERAEKIITISRRSEKDLIGHWNIDPAKITVSHIDVDEAYKRKVSPAESQKVLRKYKLKPGYIYNAGGLEKRKNIETLILAYRDLAERNKHSRFLENFPQLAISGKLMPHLSPLILDAQKLIDKLNLHSQVRLLDFVPQKDMPALYHNAGLFVYPSLYEGFGLPILEAMNQGVPAIASKRSSLPEVGLDSVLYFDPKSEKDLAMVMKNVLTNQDLRKALKKRGQERARSFSWDSFVKKFLNIALA
jgi:glycosyltransferase involved in cell wall biosynthesis